MAELFGIRGVIVFKTDELNEEWVRNELEKYVRVADVADDTMTYVDDNNCEHSEPIKMFYFNSTFGGFTKLKLNFNCFSLPDNPWVLLPR